MCFDVQCIQGAFILYIHCCPCPQHSGCIYVLQVLTRRMQLGANPIEDVEGAEKDPLSKSKGKGRGRGRGKGRGKGHGKGRGCGGEKGEMGIGENTHGGEGNDEPQDHDETMGPKPKATAKSKSKQPENGEPVRKSRARKAKGASEDASRNAAEVGGEDAAEEPTKKKSRGATKRSQKSPAEVAVGGAGGGGQNAAAPVPAAVPAAVPEPAEAEGAEGDNARPRALDQDSLSKMQAWRFVPEQWRTFEQLYAAMFADINKNNVEKLMNYTISMYWKTHRVGLVQKPKTNLLSFGAAGARRIGLPYAAVMAYVPPLVVTPYMQVNTIPMFKQVI